MNRNERKKTSKEIIDRYIGALEDDLQHYTMVDKDNVKAKLIEFELQEYKHIKQDLEVLELIKKHLYVASGLVELKITSEEYAKIHKVKFHNGIPIANEEAIDKINKWFWRNFNDE